MACTWLYEVPGGVINVVVRQGLVSGEALCVCEEVLAGDDPLRHPRRGGTPLLKVDGEQDLGLATLTHNDTHTHWEVNSMKCAIIIF